MALSVVVVSKASAFRRELKSTLDQRGYGVTILGDATAAADWSGHVDVAVLDLQLLDADLYAFADKLVRGLAHRVVFVTEARLPGRVMRWAADRGPVLHKSRLHELLHIIRVARRSRQIEMPSSVTDALRIRKPISSWPQQGELTAQS